MHGSGLIKSYDDGHRYFVRRTMIMVDQEGVQELPHSHVREEAEVVMYESEDEEDEAFDPFVHALELDPDRVYSVARAKSSDSTGGYPAHCPVLTCRKRFPNKGKVLRHWRGREHDGDRGGRRSNDVKGLMTDRDNCAKSDDPEDKKYCPNCAIADKNGKGAGSRKRKKTGDDMDQDV